MKTVIAASALLLVVAAAATAQARVDFNVNIDVPVAAAPMPTAVYAGYPSRAPQVVVEEPPGFIYSPNLGFHVSVGIPRTIVYVNNGYYLYRGGNWYLAPSYGGPWFGVPHRRLPQELRRYRYEQIRYYRDHEYRSYLRDRDHYRGTWHRPGDGRRADHRDNRRDDRGDGHRDDRGDGHRDNGGDGHRDNRGDGHRDNRWDDRRDGRWGNR